MARPRKIQMDDTEVVTEAAPVAVESFEEVTSEVTVEAELESKFFVVQIEDAVVEVASKVETIAEEVLEFMSEQTRAEIEMGRAAMQRLLGL